MKNDEPYSEILVYVVLIRQGGGRFPSDIGFWEGFQTRNFYAMNKYRSYFFDVLEQGSPKDVRDIAGGIASNDLTIEHIMPQTLNKQWREDLGPERDVPDTERGQARGITGGNLVPRRFREDPCGAGRVELVLSRPLGLESKIRTDLGSVILAGVAESQQLRLATGQVRRSIRSSTVATAVGGAVRACSLITHRWLLLRWRSGSGLISWSLLLGLFLFSSRATLLRGLRRTGDCGGRGRCVLGSTGDRGGLWF